MLWLPAGDYNCMEISGPFKIFMCYSETVLFSVKNLSPFARVREKTYFILKWKQALL